MTTGQIRQLRNAQPFRPFRLVTIDGRRIDVAEPLRIAFGKGQRLVVAREDDAFTMLDVAQVQAVEVPDS